MTLGRFAHCLHIYLWIDLAFSRDIHTYLAVSVPFSCFLITFSSLLIASFTDVTILGPTTNFLYFPPFISRSRSLIPYSFPHTPLGPLPNHLTSHLMDPMTNPQSTITCHHSAVRSIMTCPHLTFSGLPAHDAPLCSCQLMMELYLELPRHDFTLVIFPYFSVTPVTRYFSKCI